MPRRIDAPRPPTRTEGSAGPGEAALAYAEQHGWAVLPVHSVRDGRCSCGKPECGSPGKHPRTLNGVKDASSDRAQIEHWWKRWPDANIGIATGQVSGVVAVDIDGPGGESALVELCGNPPTLTSKTAKGRHLIFASPTLPVPNAVRLRPSLDIRGDGGYFVAPPSQHVSGICYRWLDEVGLGLDLPPAQLPPSLLEAIMASSGGRPNTTAGQTGAILEGTRNDSLAKIAGGLFAQGLSEPETLKRCLVINGTECVPPLPDAEVARVVASIHKRDRANRGDDESWAAPNWPDSPAAEAYAGLAGDVVRTIAPHSEADEVALLVQFLVAFGNALNRGPHFVVEGDCHPMNLFALLVGPTAKGRKGSSWGQIKRLFTEADPDWAGSQIVSGLSSGEGLIWQVRDKIEREEPVKERGQIIDRKTVVVDPGVTDKRLLVLESEFAATLRTMRRDGNVLSSVIRQAWDTGDLRSMTKNSPARATGAHISIIGHVTGDELRRKLDPTDVGNGFLNRFLVTCVRRSKCLPRGGSLGDLTRLVAMVRQALDVGRKAGRMELSDDALDLWDSVYPVLSEGKPGLLGAVTSRAEAQTRRLACLYAILDGSRTVQANHLQSALALWYYCEASARYVFGDALADPIANQGLEALRAAPGGMTQTEIRDLFSGHNGPALKRALANLAEIGLVIGKRDPARGGRPAIRFVAAEATEATEAPHRATLPVLPSLPSLPVPLESSSEADRGDSWEPTETVDAGSGLRPAVESPATNAWNPLSGDDPLTRSQL